MISSRVNVPFVKLKTTKKSKANRGWESRRLRAQIEGWPSDKGPNIKRGSRIKGSPSYDQYLEWKRDYVRKRRAWQKQQKLLNASD